MRIPVYIPIIKRIGYAEQNSAGVGEGRTPRNVRFTGLSAISAL